MDNDTRILLNLTDPHLSFSRHWLKFAVVKSVRWPRLVAGCLIPLKLALIVG